MWPCVKAFRIQSILQKRKKKDRVGIKNKLVTDKES